DDRVEGEQLEHGQSVTAAFFEYDVMSLAFQYRLYGHANANLVVNHQNASHADLPRLLTLEQRSTHRTNEFARSTDASHFNELNTTPDRYPETPLTRRRTLRSERPM